MCLISASAPRRSQQSVKGDKAYSCLARVVDATVHPSSLPEYHLHKDDISRVQRGEDRMPCLAFSSVPNLTLCQPSKGGGYSALPQSMERKTYEILRQSISRRDGGGLTLSPKEPFGSIRCPRRDVKILIWLLAAVHSEQVWFNQPHNESEGLKK